MHPILILILIIPIAIGSWMVLRGLRTSTREQKLSILKWVVIIGLFLISSYLAWTGLWRHALGVLGSLLLFLWNWRGLLGWIAGRAIRHRQSGQNVPSDASQMKPARRPGEATLSDSSAAEQPQAQMQIDEAMEILNLRPGYTADDVNRAWEDMLRTLQNDPATPNQHKEQINGHKPQAPKRFINAIHEARTTLLEALR